MTPDWSASPTADPYADFNNPQSLNLYSYTKNSPVTVKDADGHCGEDVCVVATLAGITILVMATHAYYAMPPEQRNFGTALSQATSSLSNAISGLLHPNNAGQNAPPPPSVPTNVSQGTPGTTASSVPQGTPASTSQQGTIDTSPIESRLFPKDVKQDTRQNAGSQCEYCGVQTVPGQKSQAGVSTPANQGQTDHYTPLLENSGQFC